jgi:hypothetical protein
MPEIHSSLPGGLHDSEDKYFYFSTDFSTAVENVKYSSAAKNNADPAACGKPKCQDFAW